MCLNYVSVKSGTAQSVPFSAPGGRGNGTEDRAERPRKERSMAITMTATLMRRISMRLIACLVLANLDAAAGLAQGSKYPPLSDYMMAQEAEVALARSAAPENVSAHATVKILTTSGYKVAAQGDNGFVCIVMRGWAAAISTTARERDVAYDAKVRAPHCFDPVASRTVLPLQELQAKLGMEGKGPDQIAKEVQAAYAKGELPKMEAVGFAYMFSAGPGLWVGLGAWGPHIMVYKPYYEDSIVGGKEPDSGLPLVGKGGNQFAGNVDPVDDRLAVKAK